MELVLAASASNILVWIIWILAALALLASGLAVVLFQNPFFSVSIGPCLFAGDTYSFTNGTEDPEFVYTVDSYEIPATVPVTWPAFVTITNVQPFRGGYLKSTIKIYKPA